MCNLHNLRFQSCDIYGQKFDLAAFSWSSYGLLLTYEKLESSFIAFLHFQAT